MPFHNKIQKLLKQVSSCMVSCRSSVSYVSPMPYIRAKQTFGTSAVYKITGRTKWFVAHNHLGSLPSLGNRLEKGQALSKKTLGRRLDSHLSITVHQIRVKTCFPLRKAKPSVLFFDLLSISKNLSISDVNDAIAAMLTS